MDASTLKSRVGAEFGARILGIVSGGLLIVLLARLLGPSEFGLFFLAMSVLGVIQLFTKLGIAKSTARYVSEYKEKSPEQIPHVLRTAFLSNLAVIGTLCIVLVGVNDFVAALIGRPELKPFLTVGVLYLVAATINDFNRVVLQGFEAIEAAASLLAVQRTGQLIFSAGFVFLGFGGIGALYGYIIASAVGAMVGFVYLHRHYYMVHKSAKSMEPGLRWKLLRYAVPLTLTKSANVIDKRVDRILVGFFLNPAAVGFYTIGGQISQFAVAPASSLGFTLSPSYGSSKANDETERAARLYELALLYTLAVYIPAAVGLIIVAEPIILYVFGEGYRPAKPVVQIFGIYVILDALMKITSSGLSYLGRAWDRAIVKGLTSILNLGLNVFLIPRFGVVGAAVATVITFGLYSLANVTIMYYELDFDPSTVFWPGIRIFGVTAVMGAVTFLLRPMITGIVMLIAVIVVSVSVWLGLTLTIGPISITEAQSALGLGSQDSTDKILE